MISNASLAHATLKAGLGLFLLTEPITSRKWTVPGVSNKPYLPTDKYTVSGKALADILEALVGAAYVNSSIPLT